MIARGLRLTLLASLAVMAGFSQEFLEAAQQRRSTQGVRSRPSRPPSSNTPAVRPSRPSRTTSSGVRGDRSGSVSQGYSRNSGYSNWRRQQFLRARLFGYSLSGSGFNGFSNFCSRLSNDYGYPFWRISPSFDRYSIGDVGVTPEMAGLSLRPSLERARELTRAANQMVRLVDDYSEGEMGREAFELESQKELKSIRKLAKKIRKDFYVGYLDQGRDVQSSLPRQAGSLDDLRGQVELLWQWSQSIEDRLEDQLEVARTVSLESLETVSAKSTARDLEALAKSISKATRSLPVDATG